MLRSVKIHPRHEMIKMVDDAKNVAGHNKKAADTNSIFHTTLSLDEYLLIGDRA